MCRASGSDKGYVVPVDKLRGKIQNPSLCKSVKNTPCLCIFTLNEGGEGVAVLPQKNAFFFSVMDDDSNNDLEISVVCSECLIANGHQSRKPKNI